MSLEKARRAAAHSACDPHHVDLLGGTISAEATTARSAGQTNPCACRDQIASENPAGQQPEAVRGSAVDPRLVLLARAAARLVLVQEGVMTLDDAFDGIAVAFREIVAPCTCDRETVERWERDYPPRPLASWRSRYRVGWR